MENVKGTIACINIFFANNKLLVETNKLEAFIIDLTYKLNLIPIIGSVRSMFFPKVHRTGEGVSTNIILTTSHIALHTWSEKNYMRLEVSSCGNEEDLECVEEYVRGLLPDVEKVVVNLYDW